ncbi:MAG: O-antigen ligase family protein [Anaerolineales bacterium]|nr:O-antigen ligase family protein [Anaerolineales bacterium]
MALTNAVSWKTWQDLLWLLIVILVPLWVNLWGQQPFEHAKVWLMRTLVWLLTAVIVSQALLTTGIKRPWQNDFPLARPLALLALVLVVTTFTAVDGRLSLWGSYERGQGTLTLLTYVLLCWLAMTQPRPLARTKQLAIAMTLASVPLLLLSLLQASGWNPLGLLTNARSPIYATLGRANFVGAYLVILLPLTTALAATAASPQSRRRWLLLGLGQLLVIGLTMARSSWLAAAVALTLFAWLWWQPQLTRWQNYLAASSVGTLVLSSPLLVWWLGQTQAGSTAARLTIWRSTLTLIRQRPLLGYGADALGVVFPRIYPPELVYVQGRQFFIDRAHNFLLDWTLTAGLPGLLAFVLVLVVFFMTIGRTLSQHPQPTEKRAWLIALVAAVGGNLTNNLASFDVTPTATAMWLLLGLGMALASPSAVPTVTLPAKRPLWRWGVVGVILISVTTAVWQLNMRPLLADAAARRAHLHVIEGDWPSAIAAGEQAAAWWPHEAAHQLQLSQLYYQQAAAQPAAAARWLFQAEQSLQTAQQLRPLDSQIWLQTAEFYSAAVQQFGWSTTAQADQAYQQALHLAPHDATFYTAWGRAQLRRGEAAAAAVSLQQAVALDATYGDAYLALATAELALNQPEQALPHYQAAIRWLPHPEAAYAGLADCYWQLNRPQDALQAAEQALHHNPHNQQALFIRHELIKTP